MGGNRGKYFDEGNARQGPETGLLHNLLSWQ